MSSALLTPISPSPLTRHSLFYFDDKLVVFQTQNQTFRIPLRHFTSHSPDFLKIAGAGVGDGDSDDQPIVLSDSLDDFIALVSYFHRDLADFTGTKEEWMGILRLAHKYEMKRLKGTALSQLSSQSFGAFEMLQVAYDYQAPINWAEPAFTCLCMKRRALTVAESRRIPCPDWAAAISYCATQKNKRDYGTRICEVLICIGKDDIDPIATGKPGEVEMEVETPPPVPDVPLAPEPEGYNWSR